MGGLGVCLRKGLPSPPRFKREPLWGRPWEQAWLQGFHEGPRISHGPEWKTRIGLGVH